MELLSRSTSRRTRATLSPEEVICSIEPAEGDSPETRAIAQPCWNFEIKTLSEPSNDATGLQQNAPSAPHPNKRLYGDLLEGAGNKAVPHLPHCCRQC